MSETTHKTALVIIPPEELWAPIQAIRRRHDRQLRRWMPHIGLLYPFCPRAGFEAAERAMLAVCQDTLPFELRLARLDVFHHGHGNYTLWLSPEPTEPLAALQAALLAALPALAGAQRHGGLYTPHLTLGQVKGRDAMVSLKAELQAAWQPLAFVARELSLIARDDPPRDVFAVERRLRLGPR